MISDDKMPKTDAEWREVLTSEQYHVLREKGTEPPGTGEYEHTEDKGTYLCAACGAELFPSDTKYHSGSGWPSFWAPTKDSALATEPDRSLGMARTEIKCARCGGHLGHVFDDGPADKTGKRFCVNSASLKLRKS
jgi:peptide-methionine (R)-S-oxide reductase